MSRARVFVSCLGIFLAALAAAFAAPAGERIAPDHEGRLEPCCANGAPELERASLPAQRSLPGHSMLDPDVRERWKSDALADPDVPRGHALVAGGEPRSIRTKAPATAVSFDGMTIAQSGHEGFIFLPPDTVVAASPGKVIEGSNVAVRLSNRSGGAATTRSLYNFFGIRNAVTDVSVFDPKVYYDRLSNRFILLTLAVRDSPQQAFIYLSVSRKANPATLNAPADFCNYRIPARVGASWGDFPGLGVNEKWIAVSVNNFNFSGSFRSVFLYAIDKPSLVRNGASCPSVDFWRFKAGQDGHGQLAFTVQPAQHYTSTSLAGTPLFFVSTDITSNTSNEYTLWRFVDAGNGSAKPALERDGLTGESYTIPPNARQKGGLELDTGEHSVLQSAFRDGELWTVHSTSCDFETPPNESCIRVVGITPGDQGGSITFEETIGGGDGWYFWMPGVAVNRRGDVLVAYQRSHEANSVGVGFAGKEAAAAGFEGGSRLLNGKCSLDNVDGIDRNRTGDYVGIQTDPAGSLDFWIAGEYSGQVGRFGCNWRTRIARIVF